MSRFLLVALLLFGLGIRTAELHRHDSETHAESCGLCRVALTPFTAPAPDLDVQPVVGFDAPREMRDPAVLAPASVVLEALRLRAPPCA